MTFVVSMRHAGVERIQVLRCTLYSFDVVLWFGLVQVPLVIYHFLWRNTPTLILSYEPLLARAVERFLWREGKRPPQP